MQDELPSFQNKVVLFHVMGRADQDAEPLINPYFKKEGGKLFVCGILPQGYSQSDWVAGVNCSIIWDCVSHFLVFNSPEDYGRRLTQAVGGISKLSVFRFWKK